MGRNRATLVAVAVALSLAACGPGAGPDAASLTDDMADTARDDDRQPTNPTDGLMPGVEASDSSLSDASPSPSQGRTVRPPSTSAVDEVMVGGDGSGLVVSEPFTTDGTLRGFVFTGTPAGPDRSQVVLWLAAEDLGDADTPTLPAGCVGVSGAPPDLGVEDEAEDASDGCALLQLLLFEPSAGPGGGLGLPIPPGTWRIWAEPYGPVPSWSVTYASCRDTVDANPSLFVEDELSGELCPDEGS